MTRNKARFSSLSTSARERIEVNQILGSPGFGLYLPRAISSIRARILSCGMIPMTIFLVISLLALRHDPRRRKNPPATDKHPENHRAPLVCSPTVRVIVCHDAPLVPRLTWRADGMRVVIAEYSLTVRVIQSGWTYSTISTDDISRLLENGFRLPCRNQTARVDANLNGENFSTSLRNPSLCGSVPRLERE